MTDLHFAEPQWVHLLWVVLAFVVLLVWLERRGGKALERFMGSPLQSRLLRAPSRGQRAARILFLGAAGSFLTLALMRPQWGLELVETRRAGAEIMICLDVSRSMLAEDVAPNRLERSKAEIQDLLGLLDGDQVGLIVFAGRATVLSPLTPDFGFLRLALKNANPRSVGRGGTRLEEPIRKAIDGFGDTGDVSRSILLITDGEDHDSFPLEAAKKAAERGIRILAIGFGAETGADIPITDAETGARTLLRDPDGAVVRSRLDGDLLREMALLTDGAYIPAGTGLLDLESIYLRHIAPLTRGQLDGSTRSVRNDGFQWAVLLGLLALLGATVSTVRAAGPTVEGQLPAAALVLSGALAALSLAGPWPALAQQPPASQAQDANPSGKADGKPTEAELATAPGSEENAMEGDSELPDDPRVAYNQGLAKLETGDTEAATRLLEAARVAAGSDGETRFRATYNLGWAKVEAADELVESAPAEALERLQAAAGWFREAVDLRPGHEAARYNLQIVMRRALELADSMAARDQGDLQKALDGLIQDQRGFLTTLRAAVAAQQAAADANVAPDLRRDFRTLASRELMVLADADQTSDRAVRELEGIRSKPSDQRSPEEALRAARLDSIVGHLHGARERIAQTRVRLRRMQGERAYRRAAAALGALQRARDQLLHPVSRIEALLADGVEVARLTALKAALERGIDGLESVHEAPDWLTSAYLAETQAGLESRTTELHRELASGLIDGAPNSPPKSGEGNAAEEAQRAQLVAQLGEATPLLEDARDAFGTAKSALEAAHLEQALPAQSAALEALGAARERFLDLRRLIDLVYGEEQRVAALVAEASPEANTVEPTEAKSDGPTRGEAMALGSAVHERNVQRTVRLGQMLSDAMVESRDLDQTGNPAASGPSPGNSESGRYERAYELLRKAQDSMHAASRHFEEIQGGGADHPESEAALAAAGTSLEAALSDLEALRRLFFSVLEHLQDTARRQQRLADETESLAALGDPADGTATTAKAGPLGHRQEGLATAAAAISEALQAQASAPPPEDSANVPNAPLDSERLSQAAGLVTTAGATMNEAAKRLKGDPPALDPARGAQDDAVAALAEAIDLLQEEPTAPQSGQQQQQQAEAGGESEPEDNGDESAGDPDLAQLLQGVRDRQARRREEQAREAAQRGYEPVEKDW